MDCECRKPEISRQEEKKVLHFQRSGSSSYDGSWFVLIVNRFAQWLISPDYCALQVSLFFSISICTPNYTLHTLSLCVTQAVSKRNLANELARFHYFQYFGCFRVVGIGSGRHFRLPLLSFHVTALLNSHSRSLFETRCVFPVRVLCC